ncbi:MAG: hypothetical protein GXY51_04085 [Bacteroidetes bacterium]|nr:hypothetical protein [Bacteroidota bacterium]
MSALVRTECPKSQEYALEQLAMAHARKMHPTIPYLASRKYRDDSANGLTRCIIDFLRLTGHQAERINCTGRYIDGTKVVRDTIGRTYKIGSIKRLFTSGQKGTSDISAIVKTTNGSVIPWKVEVKTGRDSQSEAQRIYQKQVESAGGIYSIVRSFDDFIKHYNCLCNDSTVINNHL